MYDYIKKYYIRKDRHNVYIRLNLINIYIMLESSQVFATFIL